MFGFAQEGLMIKVGICNFRYKVKAMVDDGTDDAIFVLSDADVNRFVKKKCASLVGAAEVSILLIGLWSSEFLYVYLISYI